MTATVTLIKKYRYYDAVTLMTLECGLFLRGYDDVRVGTGGQKRGAPFPGAARRKQS